MHVSKQQKLEIKQEIKKMFTHLHTHPERSWEEYETTIFLKDRLHRMGLTTKNFSDCTGVIGEWVGEDPDGPVVAIRTDMDALFQEKNGKWCANHSCGHDAHMTMVLNSIHLLKKIGFVPKGTIKVICQPAEETGEGALKIIEKKVLEDVDYLFGVHVRPSQELPRGKASVAIYNGASAMIEGKIKGMTSHGARPHLGKNVIEIASQMVQSLSLIHMDPVCPSSVKMTKLMADGGNINTIPGDADFALDVRAQENEILEELLVQIKKRFNGIADSCGVEITLDLKQKMAAAIRNTDAERIMEKAIRQTLGEENVIPGIITPGGEDFHFYSIAKPSLKATMLGLGCNLNPGLHHPEMTFDHEALFEGVSILAQAIALAFEQELLPDKIKQGQ